MGMPEVLLATAALANPKLNGKVALVSDARVSGVSHGAIGIHCAPEAAVGGPIASVADGDNISIDLLEGTITWDGAGDTTHNFSPFNGEEIYLREFSRNSAQANWGCVSKSVLD